jgi:hypothetical protein
MPHKEATKREVLNLNIDIGQMKETIQREGLNLNIQRCHKMTKLKLKEGKSAHHQWAAYDQTFIYIFIICA